MRIGVVGAGAIGGAVAAVLARAGHEVQVTARGAHLDAIREGGIRLSGAWGDYVAHVAAGEKLVGTPDLIIVTTKAQDAVDAIGANRAAFGGNPVLIIQNGLEAISNAREVIPEADIVGGLAVIASSFLSPGVITVTTPGKLTIGGGSANARELVQRVVGEVVPITVVDDFAAAQWTKLIVNQVNALPAITGLSAQEVVAIAGLRRILTRSIRENVRIAHASGVKFASMQGLSDGTLTAIAAAPLWIGQALPRLMARRMGETPNPGSTLQSIRRGQLTEIDFLNGAVVRAAEKIGRSAPVNAKLVELVHEVEASGSFLTPAEVVARF